MISTRNKKKARKGGRGTGPIHTPNNRKSTTDKNEDYDSNPSEPITDTNGRRSASPGGQPALSPAIPTGDDKDGPTQGVLSMPLKTDQLSAAIIDSSQEGWVYDEKNTSYFPSDIQQLLQVLLQQMKIQAQRQTQLEKIPAELAQLKIQAEQQA